MDAGVGLTSPACRPSPTGRRPPPTRDNATATATADGLGRSIVIVEDEPFTATELLDRLTELLHEPTQTT